LTRLEAELCRAKERDDYWFEVDSVCGAYGKMVDKFLKLSNTYRNDNIALDKLWLWDRLCDRSESHTLDNKKRRQGGYVDFTQFLKGKPPGNLPDQGRWLKTARRTLEFILNGTTAKSDEVAVRIIRFFFPPNVLDFNKPTQHPHSQLYFHDELRSHTYAPATNAEAVIEMRYFAFHLENTEGTRIRITRVSGHASFRQVEAGKLTRLGEATLACLAAKNASNDVKLTYIFPISADRKKTPAQESAEEFKEIAKRKICTGEIELFPIDPSIPFPIGGDRGHFVWEFFSPLSIWAHYERHIPREVDDTMLLLSRPLLSGANLVHMDTEERRLFELWLQGVDRIFTKKKK
jgi:hypothetical protein